MGSLSRRATSTACRLGESAGSVEPENQSSIARRLSSMARSALSASPRAPNASRMKPTTRSSTVPHSPNHLA